MMPLESDGLDGALNPFVVKRKDRYIYIYWTFGEGEQEENSCFLSNIVRLLSLSIYIYV